MRNPQQVVVVAAGISVVHGREIQHKNLQPLRKPRKWKRNATAL
jgi:hypothetical protein